MKKLLGLLLLFSFGSSFSADTSSQNGKEQVASDSQDDNVNAAAQEVALTFPHVQFSPGIQDLLLKLISEEKKYFLGALFRFTLYKPAEKMVERMNSEDKVKSIVIVDESNITTDFCRPLQLIAQSGGMVRKKDKPRNTKNQGNFEAMHHKFMIFGKNMENKRLVLTGSFNFTGQANLKNCENVVILDDEKSVDKFYEEIDNLWKYSTQVDANDLVHSKDTSPGNGYARKMNGFPQ